MQQIGYVYVKNITQSKNKTSPPCVSYSYELAQNTFICNHICRVSVFKAIRAGSLLYDVQSATKIYSLRYFIYMCLILIRTSCI